MRPDDQIENVVHDAADAVLFDGTSLSVSQRLGEREDLDRAESADFGLRVFIGQRQAIVSSTDKSEEAIGELVMERLKKMDRVAYIRFASVYRDFRDIEAFKEEIEALLTHLNFINNSNMNFIIVSTIPSCV